MVGRNPGKQSVEVDGRRIGLTNLDKVLYPADGFTKGDVLAYYAAVASALVPLAAGRPATRKRWPDGVGTAEEPGHPFFVKNLEPHAPDWVRRGSIEHRSGTTTYPVIDDLATLTWLAQQGVLEVHVPQWRFTAEGGAGRPDRLVLDLDPGEGAALPECAEVARLLRPVVAGMDLDLVPVTSGSKGIHLFAHLAGRWTSDQVTEMAHELARSLEADHPDLVVSDMKKENRRGKVLVDWSQNRAAKTTLVPYSLRGTLHVAASAPRTWEELDDPGLRQLRPDEVVERLQRDGDLLAHVAPAAARSDALTRYRSMRDAGRTPEPVPEAAPARGADDTFVIQEHHATRLHWDFRLERDGVLVSWALPKGVPADGRRNHLAVHTEDHPLEYAAFTGDIPKGEYGGGHVDLWDAGTYETEKFRDDEVIVTLHGRKDGGLGGEPVKVALIRAEREKPKGSQGEQWLIHRMAVEDAPADQAAPAEEAAAPGTAEPAGAPAPRAAAPEGPLPRTPSPMLAVAGAPLDPGEAWSVEMKWDGVRAVARVDGGRVLLTSRNDLDLTPTYPELQALAEHVHADGAVLDGEVVALDATGRPSFSRLQQRMGLTRKQDVEPAMRAQAVRYLLFDVLEVDGHATTSAPYRERRDLLERLVEGGGPIDVPPVVATASGDALREAVDDAMATSRRLGLEGVVVKRAAAPYRPGARSKDWVKRKHERQQEVVVGGWRPGQGRRAGGVGSLLVGVHVDGRLRYVGRVGTGFSDADLDAIEARLASHGRKTAPFDDVPRADASDAHWVTPSLVGEVRFAEWTDDGRLRQASWRGWRPDKRPEEVVREP
ncbi:ATP-dependent DNA ligase [Amnibacterium setariae]|uniref:DNA ligase (ATP) n=1 Tax=Amnibacterium setariae TaxID=2306585 RepID=A0A3A1U473_9MICO|nr:ATP-dependent DNA ligase [Amnibacterium setariae]RIX31163.1 ATP-dependent DNA ligase [Amnibacterium setariae]